jgi:hypothetical protein
MLALWVIRRALWHYCAVGPFFVWVVGKMAGDAIGGVGGIALFWLPCALVFSVLDWRRKQRPKGLSQ